MFNLSFRNKYKVYQGAHGILRSVYLLMTDLKYACHDINQHQKIRHLGDFPQSDLSCSGCSVKNVMRSRNYQNCDIHGEDMSAESENALFHTISDLM